MFVGRSTALTASSSLSLFSVAVSCRIACSVRYCSSSPSSSSRWSAGESGYVWKQRALDESRGRAIEYLTNVQKRTPIHDGVRAKAQAAQKALLSRSPPSSASPSYRGGGDGSAADVLEEATQLVASSSANIGSGGGFDWDSLFYGDDEDGLMLAGENEHEGYGDVIKALDNIPASDIQMLCDELYDSASATSESNRDKVLRSWFKLRVKQAPHSNFASTVQEERNLFTPWYLKNLTNK